MKVLLSFDSFILFNLHIGSLLEFIMLMVSIVGSWWNIFGIKFLFRYMVSQFCVKCCILGSKCLFDDLVLERYLGSFRRFLTSNRVTTNSILCTSRNSAIYPVFLPQSSIKVTPTCGRTLSTPTIHIKWIILKHKISQEIITCTSWRCKIA